MDQARRLSITGAALCAVVAAAALAFATPEHDGVRSPAARPGTAKPIATLSVAAAVCDSVATAWRKVSGAQVTRADSTVAAVSTSGPVRACHVAMVAPRGLPPAAWDRAYWTDSTSRGWREILHWAADGPDGFSRTLVRGAVRCEIDFDQDGGDDSDSTYVPSPRIAERTSCWSDPAGITARDTA
jgi:hypothetical protein